MKRRVKYRKLAFLYCHTNTDTFNIQDNINVKAVGCLKHLHSAVDVEMTHLADMVLEMTLHFNTFPLLQFSDTDFQETTEKTSDQDTMSSFEYLTGNSSGLDTNGEDRSSHTHTHTHTHRHTQTHTHNHTHNHQTDRDDKKHQLL